MHEVQLFRGRSGNRLRWASCGHGTEDSQWGRWHRGCRTTTRAVEADQSAARRDETILMTLWLHHFLTRLNPVFCCIAFIPQNCNDLTTTFFCLLLMAVQFHFRNQNRYLPTRCLAFQSLRKKHLLLHNHNTFFLPWLWPVLGETVQRAHTSASIAHLKG